MHRVAWCLLYLKINGIEGEWDMSCGLYAAVCGELAQERRIEIVTNNLANANTTGFKGDIPSFKALYPEIDRGVLLTDPAAQRKLILMQKMNMAFPSFATVKTDFSTSEIMHTGNPLDLSIRGNGFFVVNTPQGELYSRMGNFTLNEENELVSMSGYPVQGKGGSIKIMEEKVTIGSDGTVEVYGADEFEGIEIDTLKVIDSIESFRDLIPSLLGIYHSSVSNRMNEIMKVLTIIATMFIPMTFIAGIYGMNFKFIPELEWRWGYFAVWGFFCIMGLCMLVYFKRKKWL